MRGRSCRPCPAAGLSSAHQNVMNPSTSPDCCWCVPACLIHSATPTPSTDASPIPAAPNRHLPTLHHHLVTANHPAAQFGTTALVSRSPPNTSPRTGHRESRKPSTSPNWITGHFTSEHFTDLQPMLGIDCRTPHRLTAYARSPRPNTSPRFSLGQKMRSEQLTDLLSSYAPRATEHFTDVQPTFVAQSRTPHRHTA